MGRSPEIAQWFVNDQLTDKLFQARDQVSQFRVGVQKLLHLLLGADADAARSHRIRAAGH